MDERQAVWFPVWDFQKIKTDAKHIVCAYSGKRIHSIFVVTGLDELDQAHAQISTLKPDIASTTVEKPTEEHWKMIKVHMNDDLYHNAEKPGYQQFLFSQKKIIVWLNKNYITSWSEHIF
jgi:hypothetical protein